MVLINNNWGSAKLPSLPSTTKIAPKTNNLLPKTNVQPLVVWTQDAQGAWHFERITDANDLVIRIYNNGKVESFDVSQGPGSDTRSITSMQTSSSNNSPLLVNQNAFNNKGFMKKVF